MAVTKGQGNPNWTKDETILALELYLRCGARVPAKSDERVEKLSQILRSFPYHSKAARRESFRNPDGVAFKLLNIHNVATGRGLGNVSKMDREVWTKYGDKPEEVFKLASIIKQGVEYNESIKGSINYEDNFVEGGVATHTHKIRERNPKLRRQLIERRKKANELRCEICGLKPVDNPYGLALFECHHIIPVSAAGLRTTKVEDLAMLCANCHRLIHRAISLNRRWVDLGEAKTMVLQNDT